MSPSRRISENFNTIKELYFELNNFEERLKCSIFYINENKYFKLFKFQNDQKHTMFIPNCGHETLIVSDRYDLTLRFI